MKNVFLSVKLPLMLVFFMQNGGLDSKTHYDCCVSKMITASQQCKPYKGS